MKDIFLKIKKPIFKAISSFLSEKSTEQVVFLSINPVQNDDKIIFDVKDFYLVPEAELDQSQYSVTLKHEAQARIIKWAWDNDASLAEIHSHPFIKKGVCFSCSDLAGFNEFVPHIWWRLENKPYIAIVFGRNDFDALVWIDNPHFEQSLQGLLIGNVLLKPTNKTLAYLQKRRLC